MDSARRGGVPGSCVVNSRIATDTIGTATSVAKKLNTETLYEAMSTALLPIESVVTLSISSDLPKSTDDGQTTRIIIGSVVGVAGLALFLLGAIYIYLATHKQRRELLWAIQPSELIVDEPPVVLGRGTFGMVIKANYRGTAVAVKRVLPRLAQTQQEIVGSNSDNRILQGLAHDKAQLPIPNAVANPRPLVVSFAQETKHALPVSPVARVSSSHVDSNIKKHQLAASTSSSLLPAGGSFKSLRFRSVGSSSESVSTGEVGHCWRSAAASRKMSRRQKLLSDFVEEMFLLSRLRHPCITTVMGAVLASRSDPEPQLVMELMQNGSLFDLLHNETVVLEGDVLLSALRDIVQGMRFLHAAVPPIVHGDLKVHLLSIDSCWIYAIFRLSLLRGSEDSVLDFHDGRLRISLSMRTSGML